jgi:hypothetical protein
VNASGLFDLGNVALNESKDTTVVITNPLRVPLCLRSVRLARGDQGMRIIGSEPAGPTASPATGITLAPGETLRVTVKGAPLLKDKLYYDTLRIALCCYEVAMPLRLVSASQCIQASDVSFGQLTLNQESTIGIQVCNLGVGVLTFNNPNGDSVITGLTPNFRVAQKMLDSLKAVQLLPNDCITIPVTFSSAVPGTFQAVVRIWANTRDCRDTSVLTATVTKPALGVPTGNASLRDVSFTSIMPNPTSGVAAINFGVRQSMHVSVVMINALGQPIATLLNDRVPPGEQMVFWDAAAVPAGVYYCRIIGPNGAVTRPVVVAR